jgi:hypothetical protein
MSGGTAVILCLHAATVKQDINMVGPRSPIFSFAFMLERGPSLQLRFCLERA